MKAIESEQHNVDFAKRSNNHGRPTVLYRVFRPVFICLIINILENK
jgi:hypothetical protein